RWVRSASIVTMRPSKTNWHKRLSTAAISLVLSSTACWCSVTPTWCASADHTVGPGSQVRFDLGAIHAPKDRVERRGAGSVVGKAEGLSEPRTIIMSPFGHGTIAAIATQHRTTCQSEYGG